MHHPGLKYEDVVGVCITHCHNDHIRYVHEYRTKTIYGTHDELTNNKVLRNFPKCMQMILIYIHSQMT